MADVVVLNDPITGQGSNNAAKCAHIYLAAIRESGQRPYAQTVTGWTNALLTPPPEHVLQLLGAASQDQRVAHRFVNGFDDPRDYYDWFMDPAKADAYLAELAAV